MIGQIFCEVVENEFYKKKIDLVILAGGKGKRLRTITKNKVPKPLVKINGKPFLDLLLQNLSKYNFDNIFILCGYKGYQILKKYNKKKLITN